eukprot:2779218-Rhodomonas_salina.1
MLAVRDVRYRCSKTWAQAPKARPRATWSRLRRTSSIRYKQLRYGLRACYAKPGTDLLYGHTVRRCLVLFAPGTRGPTVLRVCYALSGTDLAGNVLLLYQVTVRAVTSSNRRNLQVHDICYSCTALHNVATTYGMRATQDVECLIQLTISLAAVQVVQIYPNTSTAK